MSVNDRVIFPDVALDARNLMSEELRMLQQELVGFIFCLTPVVVLGSVETVSDTDRWKSILCHEPVVLHTDVITIFEAERLVIPLRRVRQHE